MDFQLFSGHPLHSFINIKQTYHQMTFLPNFLLKFRVSKVNGNFLFYTTSIHVNRGKTKFWMYARRTHVN